LSAAGISHYRELAVSLIQASDWTSGPYFQDAVAVTAGAIAAIRQDNPSAKIIGGADSGWTSVGLPVALSQALQSEYPGDMWDYTALHWYNDANPGAATASGNMTLNIKDSADPLILNGNSYAAAPAFMSWAPRQN
jgi:hypothetical protein